MSRTTKIFIGAIFGCGVASYIIFKRFGVGGLVLFGAALFVAYKKYLKAQGLL